MKKRTENKQESEEDEKVNYTFNFNNGNSSIVVKRNGIKRVFKVFALEKKDLEALKRLEPT